MNKSPLLDQKKKPPNNDSSNYMQQQQTLTPTMKVILRQMKNKKLINTQSSPFKLDKYFKDFKELKNEQNNFLKSQLLPTSPQTTATTPTTTTTTNDILAKSSNDFYQKNIKTLEKLNSLKLSSPSTLITTNQTQQQLSTTNIFNTNDYSDTVKEVNATLQRVTFPEMEMVTTNLLTNPANSKSFHFSNSTLNNNNSNNINATTASLSDLYKQQQQAISRLTRSTMNEYILPPIGEINLQRSKTQMKFLPQSKKLGTGVNNTVPKRQKSATSPKSHQQHHDDINERVNQIKKNLNNSPTTLIHSSLSKQSSSIHDPSATTTKKSIVTTTYANDASTSPINSTIGGATSTATLVNKSLPFQYKRMKTQMFTSNKNESDLVNRLSRVKSSTIQTRKNNNNIQETQISKPPLNQQHNKIQPREMTFMTEAKNVNNTKKTELPLKKIIAQKTPQEQKLYIPEVEVTEEEIKARVELWLDNVHKNTDKRPPSALSWLGAPNHKQPIKNDSYDELFEMYDDMEMDFDLSDYDSCDDQMIEYNRVLDKTFCIVYND